MKDITTLKAALKILKKGYKKCEDFSLSCPQCQHFILVEMLADEIKWKEWEIKNNKKK